MQQDRECVICGCTDSAACQPFGCWWEQTEPEPVCSTCLVIYQNRTDENIMVATSEPEYQLPLGFPTHTQDITGETIRLGDTCIYDFPDDDVKPFKIVFQENAFRKVYLHWNEKKAKEMWPGIFLRSTNYETGVLKIKIIDKAGDKTKKITMIDFSKDPDFIAWSFRLADYAVSQNESIEEADDQLLFICFLEELTPEVALERFKKVMARVNAIKQSN